MISACFWLLAIVVSSAVSEDVGEANDYIDEVLNNLRKEKDMVSKIDPIKVPDINEDKFKGWNIVVRGLSSLHRSGDCTLTSEGGEFSIQANAAVNNIHINLNYKAKALFWISGIVDATLNRLAVFAHVKYDQAEGKVKLISFKVTEFGDIRANKVTGLSVLLNWLLKIIVQKLANKAKPRIIEAMEREVAKIVAIELEKIKLN